MSEEYEIDLDGRMITSPYGIIRLLGTARRQDTGYYHCLANVNGALCIVEIEIKEVPYPLVWEGDQA